MVLSWYLYCNLKVFIWYLHRTYFLPKAKGHQGLGLRLACQQIVFRGFSWWYWKFYIFLPSNSKIQMKKIIIFYIVCCISYILLGLASNHEQIGTRDFRFGFTVLVLFITLIYIPICTTIVGIMYYTKINRIILSNIFYGIIYCLFPALSLELAEALGNKANFHLNCIKSDYIFCEIFVLQNLLIICYGITKRYIKKCKKE